MRKISTIFFLATSLSLASQSPLSFYQIERTNQLDPSITTERSLVIIATKQNDQQWKKHANYMHKAFRVMGIDAVNYMHYLDYNASPVTKQHNDAYAKGRQINFYITLEEWEGGFRMSIQNVSKEDKKAWYSEAADLRQLVLNLAITLKRTEHDNQNFLISLQPEFLSSLSLFEGTRYPNYPSRIKRLKMAIMELPKITTDSIKDQQQLAEIVAYNEEVEKKNEIIKRLANTYPYELDILPIQSDKDLYRQGYQYVLYYLHSSVESIRSILSYESLGQPEYVSQLTLPDGKRTLVPYAADHTVYKWYIKQTAMSDLHVGRYWDAHEDFEQSLYHLLNRLIDVLE